MTSATNCQAKTSKTTCAKVDLMRVYCLSYRPGSSYWRAPIRTWPACGPACGGAATHPEHRPVCRLR